MGKLSASSISNFEANKAKRSEKLRKLTSAAFDLDNEDHIKALKEYIDNFECTANQMYLFQSLSAGINDWKGLWLVGWFLPLPDFAKSLMAYFFYVNVAGYFLERFSMDRFHNQLTEMKQIYNWSLKGGAEHYDNALNNTDKLAHPEIQRLIKLMAPLTSTDFMIAWSRESEIEQSKSNTERVVSAVSNVASSVYNATTTTYSWFFPSNRPNVGNKPRVNQNHIHDLKVAVETRSYDVDVFSGLKQSMTYFCTSPEFRKILSTELGHVKEILPAPVKALFASSSYTA